MSTKGGSRELLFSVTIKECDVQTFTVGGHGGSGKDTSNNGCRVVHRASGAVGEGRESRSLTQNRRAAFVRMAQTEEFKRWHNLEVKKRVGGVEAKKQDAYRGFGGKYVRTYVLSGKRVVRDDRTGHKRYDVENVMNGDIDSFIRAYL